MKKDGVKDGYISSDLLLNIMCNGDKIGTGDYSKRCNKKQKKRVY